MNRDDGTANIFLRTGDNTGMNRQTLDRGEPGWPGENTLMVGLLHYDPRQLGGGGGGGAGGLIEPKY